MKLTLEGIKVAAEKAANEHHIKETVLSPTDYYEFHPIPGMTYEQWIEGLAGFINEPE